MRRALRCQNLRKRFGGIHALNDVSVSFPEAGAVGIIGPNGAGKSTLLNALTGFVRPDSGTCFLGDEDIGALRPHQIVRLGIARTFQKVRLVAGLSVLEHVMLAAPHQRGECLPNCLTGRGVAQDEEKNRRRGTDLLDVVDLADKSSLSAADLSYGQQKLLSICCCVATDAGILLLDEPVAGVHPAMIARISSYIRGLVEKGYLVVFVEHHLDMVRQTADHTMVMAEGRIIASGSPGDVLKRPEILEAYVS